MIKQWKKEEVWPFLVVVQLINRLTQADISCTKTARLTMITEIATQCDCDDRETFRGEDNE